MSAPSYAWAVAECGALVRSLARSFVRFAEFDDLVQEGFLALFGILPGWREELGSLASYAYRRIRGHLFNVTKRERRRGMTVGRGGANEKGNVGVRNTASTSIDLEPFAVEATQEDELGAAEERALMAKGIELLDPRDRQVLELRNAGDDTLEIAKRIGVSHTRVNQIEVEIEERLRAFVETGRAPRERKRRGITHNGETKSLNAWAREYGIGDGTLWLRLKLGWPMARALTTPIAVRRAGRRPALTREAA